MFLRQWWAKRREAIAQQWLVEQMNLPPVLPPTLEIDPVDLENWQRAQAAERAAAGPLVALHVDTDDMAAKVEALWDWQTHFAPWLSDVLHSHHESIDFMEGHRIRMVRQMFPQEALLDSLIRTHPRPDLLLRVWNQHVPLVIDDVSEMPEGLSESHQKDAMAWQDVMRHYTPLIEQAAAHFEKHREDDD